MAFVPFVAHARVTAGSDHAAAVTNRQSALRGLPVQRAARAPVPMPRENPNEFTAPSLTRIRMASNPGASRPHFVAYYEKGTVNLNWHEDFQAAKMAYDELDGYSRCIVTIPQGEVVEQYGVEPSLGECIYEAKMAAESEGEMETADEAMGTADDTMGRADEAMETAGKTVEAPLKPISEINDESSSSKYVVSHHVGGIISVFWYENFQMAKNAYEGDLKEDTTTTKCLVEKRSGKVLEEWGMSPNIAMVVTQAQAAVEPPSHGDAEAPKHGVAYHADGKVHIDWYKDLQTAEKATKDVRKKATATLIIESPSATVVEMHGRSPRLDECVRQAQAAVYAASPADSASSNYVVSHDTAGMVHLPWYQDLQTAKNAYENDVKKNNTKCRVGKPSGKVLEQWGMSPYIGMVVTQAQAAVGPPSPGDAKTPKHGVAYHAEGKVHIDWYKDLLTAKEASTDVSKKYPTVIVESPSAILKEMHGRSRRLHKCVTQAQAVVYAASPADPGSSQYVVSHHTDGMVHVSWYQDLQSAKNAYESDVKKDMTKCLVEKPSDKVLKEWGRSPYIGKVVTQAQAAVDPDSPTFRTSRGGWEKSTHGVAYEADGKHHIVWYKDLQIAREAKMDVSRNHTALMIERPSLTVEEI